MAKKETESLLEKALKIPAQRKTACWPYTLPEKQQAEVLELLHAKINGTLSLSGRGIARLCLDEGIDASENKVSNALQVLKRSK